MFAGLIRFAPRNRTIADFYLTPYPLSILRQAQDGERSRTVKWRGGHPEGFTLKGTKRER